MIYLLPAFHYPHYAGLNCTRSVFLNYLLLMSFLNHRGWQCYSLQIRVKPIINFEYVVISESYGIFLKANVDYLIVFHTQAFQVLWASFLIKFHCILNILKCYLLSRVEHHQDAHLICSYYQIVLFTVVLEFPSYCGWSQRVAPLKDSVIVLLLIVSVEGLDTTL